MAFCLDCGVHFILLFTIVGSSYAQGLLGKRYITIQIGQTTPGDDEIEQIDDSIFQLGGGVNLPVNPNLDANISLSYEKIDGDYQGVDVESTAKGILGGINYHFTPKEKTNPFIGVRVGFVSIDSEASAAGYSATEDETYLALSLLTGIEIDLSNQVAIRPNLQYERVDDEDDFVADISLSVWLNNAVFGGIGTTYAFDDGDVSFYAGIGIGF